jgi:ADP-ribose pyrophosphatase
VSGFRRIDEALVHQGHIWSVVVADFEAPDGTTFRRDVVRSPGAVAAVPVHADGDGTLVVTLVRQYRPAFDELVLEIPAGMRDVPGEPPEETARRELVEEAGWSPGRLELLVAMYPAAGMTDAVTHIFLATDLTPAPRRTHGPEEDHLEVLHVPLASAVELIDTGEIRDAKTIIGLLLASSHLERGGP